MTVRIWRIIKPLVLVLAEWLGIACAAMVATAILYSIAATWLGWLR